MEIHQHAILKCLYEMEKQVGHHVDLPPDHIQQATGLKPFQINDAVELLEEAGLVTAIGGGLGTDYKFQGVWITAKGKLQVEKEISPYKAETHSENPRNVFVVHGRNLKARDGLFDFLRSIDLHPLEWSEIVSSTGKGAPYIGEILDKAFSQAQAVIVLMTPDDEGRLVEVFRKADDPSYETELTPQARLNVLFEAGMAMGRCSERTILVELGVVRPFSDIGGRHTIRLDNTTEKRQALAQRLLDAECAVNLSGSDWHTAGDFSLSTEDGGQKQPKRARKAEGL